MERLRVIEDKLNPPKEKKSSTPNKPAAEKLATDSPES
jgi:hypothetical protein